MNHVSILTHANILPVLNRNPLLGEEVDSISSTAESMLDSSDSGALAWVEDPLLSVMPLGHHGMFQILLALAHGGVGF